MTTCDKIRLGMRFLFGTAKKINRKTISDYKQEALVKQGREQFKKLIARGLRIPVVFL